MADESVDNLAQEHADGETVERCKVVSPDILNTSQNDDSCEHASHEQSTGKNEEVENGFAAIATDNCYSNSVLLNANGNELSDGHTNTEGSEEHIPASNIDQQLTEGAEDANEHVENSQSHETLPIKDDSCPIDSERCDQDVVQAASGNNDPVNIANDTVDFGGASVNCQFTATDVESSLNDGCHQACESPMDVDEPSQETNDGSQGDICPEMHSSQDQGEMPMSVDQSQDIESAAGHDEALYGTNITSFETSEQSVDDFGTKSEDSCHAGYSADDSCRRSEDDQNTREDEGSRLGDDDVGKDAVAYDEVDARGFASECSQSNDGVCTESFATEPGDEINHNSQVNEDVGTESIVTEPGDELNQTSQADDEFEMDEIEQDSEEPEMRDLVEGDDFTVELEPEEAESDVTSAADCTAEESTLNSTGVEKDGSSTETTPSNNVDQSTNETSQSELAAPVDISGTEASGSLGGTEKIGDIASETLHTSNAGINAELGGVDSGSEQKSADHSDNECAVKSVEGEADSAPAVPKKEVLDVDDKPEPPKPPVKVVKTQECIVCKKIVKCKYNIVRNGDTKHLCDDNCFKVFRAKPTAFLQPDQKSLRPIAPKVTCDYCMNNITSASSDKFAAKLGKEQKKFCRMVCMNSFQKRAKNCSGCGKDIQTITTAFSTVARLLNGMADMKAYCSRACHSRTLSREAASSERTTTCSVCSKVALVRREIALDGVMHQLCSESCFVAFRYANKLPADICDECAKSCTTDVLAANTIQYDAMTRQFCSAACITSFRRRCQCEMSCEWCNTRQSNFEMVERVDQDGRVQRFCSLNCLSLYRVNMQANSGQAVSCDQCRTCVPAQYHLTMSDASVRNFCSYPCVAAFQAQFAMPVGSDVATAPTPGQKVTANASNTSPASGSMMPPSNKNNLYGTRQSSRVQAKKSDMVISNIVSLAAPPKSQKGSYSSAYISGQKSASSAATNTEAALPQVIVAPPAPKELRNKALLCKPFMQTKATSCRPHSITKSTQTDEDWEPKRMLLPCPVPLMMPAPMAMYTAPTPVPILVPVPIPVPCFIPTSRKTSKKIFKKIKEMQEKMPSDPFEAELLMMAEAVAHGGRGDDSESEASDDEAYSGPPSPDDSAVPHQAAATYTGGTKPGPGGEMGTEDMLQMALRMASEMTEGPIMDLEDNVDAAPVRHLERPPVQVQEYSTISHDTDIMQSLVGRGRGGGTAGGNRGKRRSSAGAGASGGSSGGGGGSAGKGRGSSKRPKLEESNTASQSMLSAPVVPAIPQPPADANCMLKFTYGVNAYKHWVLQKNAQIEKSVPPNTAGPLGRTPRGVRLLKLDPLHCTADELNIALCMFVREVRKPNGEQYAPDSILYLCLGIQQYLFENNRIDNIFTDFFYERFTECLNEILSTYEVSLNSQGLLVCRIEEEHLWECKQLGAHSPHVLLNTLIYFNTKHFMLRTPSEHLALSFSHIMKHWKKTSSPSGKQGRSVYLRYYSPAHNVTDPSGQKRRKEELPVFEQAENVDNPLRCPVKLYEFYLSKCPESIKNRNDVFYLVPERSCVPDSPVWYSTMSLGLDAMTKMLNRLRPVREIQEAHLQAAQIPGAGGYYG